VCILWLLDSKQQQVSKSDVVLVLKSQLYCLFLYAYSTLCTAKKLSVCSSAELMVFVSYDITIYLLILTISVLVPRYITL